MQLEEEEEQQGAVLRRAGQKTINVHRASLAFGSPRLGRNCNPTALAIPSDDSPLSARGSRSGRCSFAMSTDQSPSSHEQAAAEWGRLRAAAGPSAHDHVEEEWGRLRAAALPPLE